MRPAPIRLDEFVLEDHHARQLLTNALWAEEIKLFYPGKHRVTATLSRLLSRRVVVGMRINTEQRPDALAFLARLHEPGTDYMERWTRFRAGPYLAWQVRLSLPGHRDLSISGPCNPALNRAFRHATAITLLPLTADGASVDDERTTTISGDCDYWRAVLRQPINADDYLPTSVSPRRWFWLLGRHAVAIQQHRASSPTVVS